jgi:hypothetical protein
MPRARKIAEIEVNGQRFTNWETVSVDRRFPAIATQFAMTVASPIESAPNWSGMKLAIGDVATVYLAGHKVASWIIRGRQPAYDDKAHGLQISGTSYAGAIVQPVDHPGEEGAVRQCRPAAPEPGADLRPDAREVASIEARPPGPGGAPRRRPRTLLITAQW